MPNPNAVVSGSIRFEPPLDRSAEEIIRSEGGLSVDLGQDRRARLDPADDRSTGFAQILDGLSRQGLPVYLELDPDTSAITRLLIPHVARVAAVRPTRDGTLDVELSPSHARHVLSLSGPDAADIEGLLRGALESQRPVVLTEDDAHQIIDVRPFTPGPDWPEPPLPPFPPPRPKLPPTLFWPLPWIWLVLRWIWWWICFPWWWYHCPSTARAQQIFNAMASTTCAPLTVPSPCIPFLYPDDGCWARAHEMSRLMIAMGLTPRKVWIDANTFLHVNTRNNPNCYVDWGWHVAPTLCVRTSWWWFHTERMVIDPSLFTTPVTEATWKGVQGDPGATLTDTDASVFWHGGGTDPGYTNTNYYLGVYRSALQSRSIQQGPPPYANCP